MPLVRKTYRKYLPLEKRDLLGLSHLDVIRLKSIEEYGKLAACLTLIFRKRGTLGPRVKRILSKLVLVIDTMVKTITTVQYNPRQMRKEVLPRRTLNDFNTNFLSTVCRFRSIEDLRRLITGFRLPPRIKAHTYVFSNEEVLMISLTRLSRPFRWTDVMIHFPDRSRQQLQAAFYWFLDFMVINWGYLLLNNREYWKPYLAQSAEAIRQKLATLPNDESRRLSYNAVNEDNGFAIFGFIDNTIVATCRPGGGPTFPGILAPRVDPTVQQAWWTGWKKLHGLKWQTVLLANGMDFDVWGPVSVRHNDNFVLYHSQILKKISEMQEGEEKKFKLYGDSAYFNEELLVSGCGKGMSSIREAIEWRYRDLKSIWAYLDYRHSLQLRKQPLAKIVFTAMLLSNAHCTMYGSEAAEYFLFPPPPFEDWIGQGPHAHPIPNDIFFNDDL